MQTGTSGDRFALLADLLTDQTFTPVHPNEFR